MTKWDYRMPAESNNISQTDWNQTIVTTFNRVSLGMRLPIYVQVPIKFKPIFESLVFYNNGMIDERFMIDFIDVDENIIHIGKKEFEILNFDPPKSYKKPPIGLMPRDIHNRSIKVERFYQVCGAISRYYGESLKIPIAWIEEYNELVDDIKDFTDVYEKET